MSQTLTAVFYLQDLGRRISQSDISLCLTSLIQHHCPGPEADPDLDCDQGLSSLSVEEDAASSLWTEKHECEILLLKAERPV